MCKAGNLNIFLKSQSLEGKTEHVEEWHKTKYSVHDFTQSLKDKIAKPNVSEGKLKLTLPPKNNLIAKDFTLLPEDLSLSAAPQLLKTNCTDVWYKKDDKFKVPKANVDLKIYPGDSSFISNAQ